MLKEITKSLDKFFIIAHQPLFQKFSDKEKTFIANRSEVVEYSKNDIIYHKGQKKNYLYVIITGRVDIYNPEKIKSSRGRLIEQLMKGDYFGIVSVMTGNPHSLSAKAVTDAKLIRISAESYGEIEKNLPELAVYFNKALSRRLREKNTADKYVFQRTILAVYYNGDEDYSTDYAGTLANALVSETGKKTIILSLNKNVHRDAVKKYGVKTVDAQNPNNIIPILSHISYDHHYVIVDLPKHLGRVEKKVAEQCDICHMLSDNYFEDIQTNLELIFKLGKRRKEEFKLLIKDNKRHPEIDHLKCGDLSYTVLPKDTEGFNYAVRKSAREVSGKSVGLALGAGGALGLAQLGILSVIEKEKINIDIIAGTSMGALNAAFWACGFSADKIIKILSAFDSQNETMKLIDLVMPAQGLIGGKNIRKFLESHLGDRTFYDTKIPLRIIACDIENREEAVISRGKIVDAVMASIAIPGIFNPVITPQGRMLVDGGIVTPVPISVLSQEGIKRVIGVNSMPAPEDTGNTSEKKYSIFDIIVNSMYSMEYRIGKYACQEADIYLHPILKNAAWHEFYRIKEFVALGKREAAKAIPLLKKLTK